MADFIAGVWHWIEDRYFDTQWPLIGKYIAKPNELHHEQPTAFLYQGYWSRNWTTLVPAVACFSVATFAGAPDLVLWALVFVTQANEIHAFAHRKGKLPKWITILQETGVFQSPKHHGEHHRSPHLVRYCVMSNWLNPWLDWLQFWRRLEWLLERTIGLRPKSELIRV